jgi:hypothetical protein
LEVNSVGSRTAGPALRVAVGVQRPCTGLDRLDGGLDVLTDARAGGAGVDRELEPAVGVDLVAECRRP